MREFDFLSIYYPPVLLRGYAGTGNRWTSSQFEELCSEGFQSQRRHDPISGREIGTDEVRVVRGSPEHLRLIEIFRRWGVQPAERIESRGMPESVRDYEFYSVNFGAFSDGFDGRGIFSNELDCGQPPPEGPNPGPRGCGLGKSQVHRLRLVDPKRVRKADIMPVWAPAYCESWRLIVVTRRLYEVMQDAGLTGVQFHPVLSGPGPHSEEEIRFGNPSSKQIAQSEYFQLVITGRTLPVPLEGIDKNNPCPKCKRLNGVELRTVSSFRWRRENLQSDDLQVAAEYVLPDGDVVQKKGDDAIIASARFIEVLLKAKARGLSFRGSNSAAGPLYVEA